MSEHFIQYAFLASYLEPKLPPEEIIDAVRLHFPAYIQRAMIGVQINTTQEAIHFFRRLEMLEVNENYNRQNPAAQGPVQNKRPEQNTENNRPRPNQQYVRHVYEDKRNNYSGNRYNGSRYNDRNGARPDYSFRNRESNNDPSPAQRLNPNAPTYHNQATNSNATNTQSRTPNEEQIGNI
jgi:hypothetical protein